MAVRNFWIAADVDGYQNLLEGGPRRKDGGLDVTIYQRDDGSITHPIRIFCRAEGEQLTTDIYVDGERVAQYKTER